MGKQSSIIDVCWKTAKPVFFTENGEGDLVVMDIETYNKWKTMQRLKEELLAVEEDRAAGRAGCTLDELDAYLDDMIAGEWQMAQLQGDEEAAKALTGENAKILRNANWQDIEKNR